MPNALISAIITALLLVAAVAHQHGSGSSYGYNMPSTEAHNEALCDTDSDCMRLCDEEDERCSENILESSKEYDARRKLKI